MKITKSQLKKLIIQEFNKLDGGLENTPEEGGFQTEDGWNEGAFEEAGIMEILTGIERAIYEIKNGLRGSYADIGDTEEEFLENLGWSGIRLGATCLDIIGVDWKSQK